MIVLPAPKLTAAQVWLVVDREPAVNTPEDLHATIRAIPGRIIGADLPGALMLVGGLIGLWRRQKPD